MSFVKRFSIVALLFLLPLVVLGQVFWSVNKISDFGRWPAVAWLGDGYGAVWIGDDLFPENNNLFFAKLDVEGRILGKPQRITYHGFCKDCLTAAMPVAAWNGDKKYGVVWIDNKVVKFAILDSDGRKLSDVELSDLKDKIKLQRPYLKWIDGGAFAVGWEDEGGRRFYSEVNKHGTVLILNKVQPNDEQWQKVSGRDRRGIISDAGGSIYFTEGEAPEMVNGASKGNKNPFLLWNGYTYASVWEAEDGVYFGLRPRLGFALVRSSLGNMMQSLKQLQHWFSFFYFY